jgi:hypothetical protein
MIRSIVVVSFFVICANVAQGQDIKSKTITWDAVSIFNVGTGDMKEESHQIISNKNNTVEWKTPAGESKVFQVNEVLGQWTNVASNGEIVYEVRRENKRGTITFLKNQSGIAVRILLVDDSDALPSNFEFKISNIQVQ